MSLFPAFFFGNDESEPDNATAQEPLEPGSFAGFDQNFTDFLNQLNLNNDPWYQLLPSYNDKLKNLKELSLRNYTSGVSAKYTPRKNIFFDAVLKATMDGCFKCEKAINEIIEIPVEWPKFKNFVTPDVFLRYAEEKLSTLVEELIQEVLTSIEAITAPLNNFQNGFEASSSLPGPSGVRAQNSTNYCRFCFSTQHKLMNHNDEIVCDVLLQTVCSFCKTKGHTQKYCAIFNTTEKFQEI